MEELVIDSSVIAKWFIIESLRDKALKLRDDYLDGKFRLAAPHIMPLEVLNATRLAQKNIGATKLAEIGQSLSLYGVRLFELRDEYLREAVETALKNEITIFDASYIALAKHLQTRVCTADTELLDRLHQDYRQYATHLHEYR